MQSIQEISSAIKQSFIAATKGQETIKNLIWRFGIPAYVVFYFMVEKTIKSVDYKFVDLLLSIIGVLYFSWHIFVMFRCSPKKPQISKEEKRRLRQEAIRNAPRKFIRKLFLKEPITKWNSFTMTIAVDILFCMQFLGYIIT